MLDDSKLTKVRKVLVSHVAALRDKLSRNQATTHADLLMSYGQLAKISGFGVAIGMRPYLNAIAAECTNEEQPSLDCLVVNARTSRSGVGKWQGDEWEAEVRKFYPSFTARGSIDIQAGFSDTQEVAPTPCRRHRAGPGTRTTLMQSNASRVEDL